MCNLGDDKDLKNKILNFSFNTATTHCNFGSKFLLQAICRRDSGKITGLHLTGPSAGEMMQGFAAAFKWVRGNASAFALIVLLQFWWQKCTVYIIFCLFQNGPHVRAAVFNRGYPPDLCRRSGETEHYEALWKWPNSDWLLRLKGACAWHAPLHRLPFEIIILCSSMNL